MKLHTFCDQLILKLKEVFNNAVLHNDHPPGLTEMRVGIAGVGCAMRCPARMTDARRAVDGRLADEIN